MKYFADSALTAEDLYRRSMWWAAWMVRCYKMLAHELLGKTMFWDLCVKNCHLSSHWMTCLSLILCVALHSLPVGGKVWHLQVQTRVRQQFHLWIWPGGWKRMPWLLRGWCCFISLCTFFPAACFEDCQEKGRIWRRGQQAQGQDCFQTLASTSVQRLDGFWSEHIIANFWHSKV